PDRRPIPATSSGVRQSLFDFAVSQGGERGWFRMSRAQGRPLADQLSALAGMPVDSLLTRWQRALRAERHSTVAGLGSGFLMVLAWSIFGSLFFAWRYRWRHV